MSKKNFGNDGIQVCTPKFEKNVARTLQRGYSAPCYFRTRGHVRLSGGADAKSTSPVNVSKPDRVANSEAGPEVSHTSKTAMDAEEEIEAILAQSNDEESTGDKKVDEMIEYVIQNLQEAGKALASLGENFEHNLKLMFVDVMGKVQNWVSLAQIRIDVARNDLKNLRRELISRSHELAEVKKNLAECEVAKGAFEKALSEQNAQKSSAELTSHSELSFIPARQPLPTVDPSEHTPDAPDTIVPATQVSQSISPVATSEPQVSAPSVSQVVQPQRQLAEPQATADVAVQSGKGKDRRRESELELELARLRKQNDQIARERTKYENAVRRALLRGVSSLNTETLKVLRCPPPVSCYIPCVPSPSSPDHFETLTPCSKTETKDNRTDAGCRMPPVLSCRQGDSRNRQDERSKHEEFGCCAVKRQTASAYASSSRYRKSSGCDSRSMAFILQEAAPPAACTAPCNASQGRSCGRTKSKKLDDSVCAKKLG